MNSDLLKDFKEEFLKKLEENKRKKLIFEALMQRKGYLENSRVVQDYIALMEQIKDMDDEVLDEGQIFWHVLFDYEDKGLVSETNGILLYAGSFFRDQDYLISVDRNSSDAEFDNYIDIESFDEIDIPVEDREIFEKEHKVIVLDDESSKYSLYELHGQFMYYAVNEGEEVACQKILSRNKKNL